MIDLIPFCAKANCYRSGLQQPFTQGDYSYATDGHLVIRVAKQAWAVNSAIPIFQLAERFAKADVATYQALSPQASRQIGSASEQRIGAAWFDSKYIAQLRGLPGIEVCPVSALDAMAFRFRGGMGLLMPVRDPLPTRRAA